MMAMTLAEGFLEARRGGRDGATQRKRGGKK